MSQCPKCNINAFHNNVCNRCGYVGKKKQPNKLVSKNSFSKFYIIIPAIELVSFFIFTDKGKMLFFNYYNELVTSNNITTDKKSNTKNVEKQKRIEEQKESKSSSNSNSTTMGDSCNATLTFLKTVGFNFKSYRNFNPFRLPFDGGVSCGITNTGNIIHLYTKPIVRIFVFDKPYTGNGYCVQLSGRYEKTASDDCY